MQMIPMNILQCTEVVGSAINSRQPLAFQSCVLSAALCRLSCKVATMSIALEQDHESRHRYLLRKEYV
jgi:hypothetical protein